MIETGGHSMSAAVRSPASGGEWPHEGVEEGGSGWEGLFVPWLLKLLRALGWANVSQEAIRSPCRRPGAWVGVRGSGRRCSTFVTWTAGGRGNPRGSDPHVTNRRLTSVAGEKVGQALLIYRRCLA